MSMVLPQETVSQIDNAIMTVRQYFTLEYHAGTREMVYRYVAQKMGDVNYNIVSVALRVLRDNGEIIYEKRVWWRLTIK